MTSTAACPLYVNPTWVIGCNVGWGLSTFQNATDTYAYDAWGNLSSSQTRSATRSWAARCRTIPRQASFTLALHGTVTQRGISSPRA